MKKTFLTLLLGMLVLVCFAQKSNHITVDIRSNMESTLDLKMSDFIEDIIYVPLETNLNCVIDMLPNYLLVNNYLLVGADKQNLMKFDLEGNFLGVFAKLGKGPGEYQIISELFYNSYAKSINILDGMSRKVNYYSPKGDLLRTIDLPVYGIDLLPTSNNSYFGVSDYQQEKDGKYFSCFEFITDGQVEPFFYERKIGKPKEVLGLSSLFHWGKNVCYLPSFTTTLYEVDENKDITKFFFDAGKLELPKKLLSDPSKLSKNLNRYVFSLTIFPGIHNSWFISYYYDNKGFLGILDPQNGQLSMIKQDENRANGIINDIDGGVDFHPLCMVGDECWYQLYYPHELKELLQEQRIQNRQVKFPDKKQKLVDLIEKLEDDDNPVLMIMKKKVK